MPSKIKPAAGQSKYTVYIQYFFLAFFILMMVPSSFYHRPEEGIDNSWHIALHLAYKYDLVFGKDLIFTYGPLGIIHTRLPISVNLLVYLIFDIYFLATLFFILKEVIKKYFSGWLIAFIFLSIMTTISESLDIWYFFFFLFCLFSFLQNTRKTGWLAQAALLSVICFYFKVSIGIISIGIFLITISYSLIRKKLPLKNYLLTVFLFLFGIWLAGWVLNTDIIGYLKTSLHFISDYNDSMFRPLNRAHMVFIYLVLFIILLFGVWVLPRLFVSIRRKEFIKNLDEFFMYGIMSLCLYVFFKSGFVRGESHFHIFFKGAALLTTFLFLFCTPTRGKKLAAIYGWVVLLCSFWAVNAIRGDYKPYLKIINLLPHKGSEIVRYVKGISNYNKAVAASEQTQARDNEIKRLIGNNTVDIIPDEISEIYFNGLHYHPRPVIQSYAAYNGYLDSLNYQKYMSADAPMYILFALSSIDGRFPFFDESKTKTAIISRYTIIGEWKTYLVLKRKETQRELIKSKTEETTSIKFGEDIVIKKTSDLQYSKFIIQYSLWGKIKRLFFQPPALEITFTLENGEIKTYRAIKPILESGVLINKYIDTRQDFQLLMQTDGRYNADVKKIRIGPDLSHSGFKDDIKMVSSFYSITEKSPSEFITDSTTVAKLLNRYEASVAEPSNIQEDNIRVGLQSVKAYSPLIEIEGWAFRENADNKKAIVKAILKSRDKIYELETKKILRPDLPPFFKRNDVGSIGFLSTVSKSRLDPGDYQLGVMISYSDSGKKSVAYVPDNHFLIRSEYRLEKLDPVTPMVYKDNIQYSVSGVQDQGDQVFVEGWAFVKEADSKEILTNLILQDSSGTYRINTDIINRADISTHFKNPLLDYSGFQVMIPKDGLPKGSYRIIIEKLDLKTKQRSMVMTDANVKM